MSLTGNLEDLPLLDIIQIVSFSKKTGHLSIQMEGGEGGIVFREGLVVAAFTAASPPVDPRLGTLPADRREDAVKARVTFALGQLARLREGLFAFALAEEVPRVLGSRDLALETLAGGINPQELLLDLAVELDEDRARSAAAIEASFAAPEEGVVPEAGLAEGAAGGGGGAGEPELVLADEPEVLPELAATDAEPSTAAEAWHGAADRLEPPSAAPAAETDTAPMPSLGAPPAGARALPAPVEAGHPPDATLPPRLARAPEPGGSAGAGPVRALLLVDDEEDVRDMLGRHFSAAGYRVYEAGDPESAAKVASQIREEGHIFVLVTDLGMPASGGASFHGGFEVVKRIWKMNLRPPVLMMTESLSQSLRLRARQMGVQAFVFKPGLSKLNPRQFEADLTAFAAKLEADVLPGLAERAAVSPGGPARRAAASSAAPLGPPEEEARPFDFLRRRLPELGEPGDANQVAILVMKVAREFVERGILFVVKNEEARGIGGFGLAPRGETLNLLVRQIAIPLAEPSVFTEVAQSRRPFIGQLPADRWSTHLLGRIGRFRSRGIALLPLVTHHETVALLFGDNPETGNDASGLEAFEVFMNQAGIALENVFLLRKLASLQDKGPAGLS